MVKEEKPKKRLKFHAWYIGILITLFFCVTNIFHSRDISESADGQTRGLFGFLERAMFDYRIRNRGTRPTSDKVGLLAIDEKSIQKFGRWPFTRSVYSDVFSNLKKAGVQWIALDVLFTESQDISLNEALEPMQNIAKQSLSPTGLLDPRRFFDILTQLTKQSPTDTILGDAIAEFQNIVQAYLFIPDDQGAEIEKDWSYGRKLLSSNRIQLIGQRQNAEPRRVGEVYPLVNIPTVSGQNPILGFINNTPDQDGLIRRYKLIEEIPVAKSEESNAAKEFVPSLGLQIASRYLNKQVKVIYGDTIERVSLMDNAGNETRIPLTGLSGHMLINHHGYHQISEEKETPIVLSFADVYDNKLPKLIPDILILGSTTIGADDKRPSPLNPFANGPEHHVSVIDNILRTDFLNRPVSFVVNELFFTLVAGLLLCVLMSRATALISLVILITTHVALEFIDQKFIFGRNAVFNFGIFHLQNATIFVSMTLFKYFIEEREKREIKGAFQHYLNPSVINQVLDSPEGLKLGGEKRELTVFFSDIRGFTTISEMLSPEALASLLNEYFTPMTNIVLDSGGLLDKYIGDALMAVWGAPLPTPDHADRAVHSALLMLDALDHLRAGWKNKNLPMIDIGCGINTGPMVVGNMGSTLRFDYTVLGDAVNLGSRLEGITKEYGVRIICSETTKSALKYPEKFILRELDWIKVKGKNEPVTIYEVMRASQDSRSQAENIRTLFESGLRHYRQRLFQEAQAEFIKILQLAPQDGPSAVFLERCEYFIEHPVNENWDGIWVMKSK